MVFTFSLVFVFVVLIILKPKSLGQVFRVAWLPMLCGLGILLWVVLHALGVLEQQSDSHAAWVGVLKTGMYLSFFVLTLCLVRTHDQLEAVLWVIVVAGVCQVLIKIVFDQSGTYVNRNHFAGYLEMSLALAIGLMLSKFDQTSGSNWRASLRSWIRVFLGPKFLIRVLIVVLVIGLILSKSRMGNIGFFVGLGVAGLIGLWTFKSVGRTVLIFFASILTIDVFLMGAFFGIEKLQQRFEQLDTEADVRSFLNEHSTLLVQQHWPFGTGPGSYYSVYPTVRNEKIHGFVQHAHNDYAQFLIEFGVASILLAIVVGHSTYTAIKVQVVRRSRFMRAVGFASLMAIVSLMVHATVEFNFQLTANASTFMVILALPYLAMTVDRRKGSAL